MELELTKDAERLLDLLYTEYLNRLKDGRSKSDAKSFGSAKKIQSTLLPDASLDWVEEACWELSRNGLLKVLNADDTVYLSFLETKAIVYMERLNGSSTVFP